MDPSEFTIGTNVPIQSPIDPKQTEKCEIISKKHKDNTTRFYVHYLGLNRRYDRWVDCSEFILTNQGKIEFPKKKKKDEVKVVKDENEEQVMRKNPEDELRIRNVDEICIRDYMVNTWYFSPYPKDVIKNGRVYLCEFCLYYFSTMDQLAEHAKKCTLRHPPGYKIYTDGELSFFEIDGYFQKNYCRNLSLLSKLFLDHKSLYYDIDVFMFYILCRQDNYGYQIVGYFSKEKVSEQGFNLACILTLPFEQRKGYGKYLIDFSYMLSRRERKIAGPEKPLSDFGLLSYRGYWLDVILEELRNRKDMSIKELSEKTYIAEEDITGTLIANKMIKYYGEDLVIALDEAMNKKMNRERRSKVKEDCLMVNY